MKKIYILNRSTKRCVATGKQMLRNKKSAIAFSKILYYSNRKTLSKRMRAYRCEWCLRWHLTRKEKHNG